MAATAKDEQQITLARGLNHVPWCEEYEKMISGMLYNSLVPELDTARSNIRRACHEYNSNFPPDNATLQQERLARLKNMLGHVEGEEVYMEPPIHLDYGCNIRVGDRFYSNFNLTILDCGLVTFGDRVMIGPNVSIFAATHETEVQSRRDNIEYTRPVTIGDDVWIGGHVVILPGVDIGQGCTIAAGSMVTKSIPAWSVAMGSPAKVVKKVTPLEPLEKGKKS